MGKANALITGLLLLGLGAGSAVAAGDGAKHKVVYHLNSGDVPTQKATLRNIQNHINAVGKDNLDLRVVMHGDGVSILQLAKKDEDVKSGVDNLKMQGVTFNVCRNTLTGKKLDYKTDLYDTAEKDIVPSGVAEVANLQMKGFAYVKP